MRHALPVLLCLAMALPAGGARAQAGPETGDPVVAEPDTQPQAKPSCVDVQVGSAHGYDCLNAELGNLARAVPKPSSLDAPLSATSPGYQAGAANAAATANRLGPAYGKSAIATRPGAFTPPPMPHVPR